MSPVIDSTVKTVKVKIEIDVDELRHWAGKHADAGHAGVAHVLYKAAEGVESLTEQALREARAEILDQVEQLLGEAWDDGNAVGCDGWAGPNRGAEIDREAVAARRRCVRKLTLRAGA